MIQLIDVEKKFENQQVLDRVNLNIPDNKITTIIGASGSGKSVILKHMIGLLRPDSGRVVLDNVDISKLGQRQLSNVRKSYSMLFQGAALMDSLTVFENVALPLKELTKMKENEIHDQVQEKLEQVGMSEMGYKYPAQLSGGMKKRVGLARALITKPKTILFDEPTSGLDPFMTNRIHKLIKTTHEAFNLTVVIVSHEIPKVFYISDYVAVLYKGKIIEFDTSQRVLDSKNPLVTNFVKGGIGSEVGNGREDLAL